MLVLAGTLEDCTKEYPDSYPGFVGCVATAAANQQAATDKQAKYDQCVKECDANSQIKEDDNYWLPYSKQPHTKGTTLITKASACYSCIRKSASPGVRTIIVSVLTIILRAHKPSIPLVPTTSLIPAIPFLARDPLPSESHVSPQNPMFARDLILGLSAGAPIPLTC
ncbi:MAG: hypothetical protein JOS17DRAFT_779948 [Linnemannia elongata]|nr:MAG: hypothetical protein JOS17DRAFT_779948 [Linnemannia elongata]